MLNRHLLIILVILVILAPVVINAEEQRSDMKIFVSKTIDAKFVLIPAGKFIMGCPDEEKGFGEEKIDEKQHEVTITKPFYMQTTAVTQKQWKEIMGNNPSCFDECGENCPVDSITWNDVQIFIEKLNKKERTNKYRLPTEAEWEYAARAGTTTPFNTGKCLSTDQANYNGENPLNDCPRGKNRKTTVPVGSFPPNAWGLYDMHGNIEQYVQDWFGKYPSEAVIDPIGPSTGTDRVLRGGNWGDYASGCRSAARSLVEPDWTERSRNIKIRFFTCGFRLARTL
jgi:Uncharacterized conserved protein